MLPADLVAALDLPRLELVNGASFIDEALAEREVDLLYTVPLAQSEEHAFPYVLFEHQSSVDPRMPARLLVYMARIWDQWMREHPSGDLPPVVPVVLHHSATGWTRSTRFVEGLAIPEPLGSVLEPYVPDFEFLLDDLTRVSEEELHARAVTAALRLMLGAMRLGRDGEPTDVDRWARLLLETLSEPSGHQAFEALLRYLVAVRDDDFVDVLVRATKDARVETIAMTYKERLIRQGLEQGLQKGEAKGARHVLAKQLRLKFGELDESTERRLEAATLDELDRWSEGVLTAESLEAVFAG